MIITCCIGGLGNQMFQYAMGYALAKRLGTQLKVDVRMFEGYALHNGFELDRDFVIDAPVASDNDIRGLIGWRAGRIGRRLMSYQQLSFLKGKHYYTENGLAFNRETLSLPEDCYLYGHWQSERYFRAVEPLIREQFRFKRPLSGKNADVAAQIDELPVSVSLHVRRGDYITNPHTNAGHGTCAIGYYERARRHIEERVKEPVYFVFSDDVGWVRENLQIDREHYFVDHNAGTASYNDMRLMSLCNHHIIANSSFSWWGAWLDSSDSKIVVAPDQWFQNPEWDSRDHIPESWVRL